MPGIIYGRERPYVARQYTYFIRYMPMSAPRRENPSSLGDAILRVEDKLKGAFA